MLTVPQSLLQCWSDYRAVFTCEDSMLRAVLDGDITSHQSGLDLRALHREGRHGVQARRRLRQATEQSARWCVTHGRYVNNIDIPQKIDMLAFVDLPWLCTPVIPRDGDTPRSHRAWWLPTTAPTASTGIDDRQTELRPRVSGELPNWSTAVRRMSDNSLVLIDAPLCLHGESGTDAFLCDYAEPVRQDQDTRVPLSLSAALLTQWQSAFGDGCRWHAHARTLGLVRHGARGSSVHVLQIALRAPLPQARASTHEPPWHESLLKEAQPGSRSQPLEVDWLKEALDNFPAPSGPHSDRNLGQALQAHLARHADKSLFSLTRRAASPYEGTEALWVHLATMLPDWQTSFPLSSAQWQALLAAFDSTFDEAWRQLANRLLIAVSLRYTPEAMARIRARIKAMAHPPP